MNQDLLWSSAVLARTPTQAKNPAIAPAMIASPPKSAMPSSVHVSDVPWMATMSEPLRTNASFSIASQMAGFHVDRAAVSREWRVFGKVRIAQPASSRIIAMLVLEGAIDHQNFLTTPVAMPIEPRTRSPLHKRDIFSAVLMQGHNTEARHHALMPRRATRVDEYVLRVAGIELMQLHQHRAPRFAMRRVRTANRIAHVAAGGVVTIAVGKYAVEHEQLLTAAMRVVAETRVRRVTHD